jgi:antitoxin component YwqK of YwqJK toxin-antitoxin module
MLSSSTSAVSVTLLTSVSEDLLEEIVTFLLFKDGINLKSCSTIFKDLDYDKLCGHRQPHGEVIMIEDGIKVRKNCREGLLHGKLIEYYPNEEGHNEEKIHYMDNYIDNLREGNSIAWYSNGNMKYFYNFHKDILHGRQVSYKEAATETTQDNLLYEFIRYYCYGEKIDV